MTREVRAAQKVKDQPVLVIVGNPPYAGASKNKGKWITELVRSYKTVDGEPLGERNSKWLQDDYVKFIRFAQWKMDQVDSGIVGMITNHGFLANPTFRGMRQSLMHTFNQVYVLDLHGSSKKKEQTPSGGKDENVFDIKPGVAISVLVKEKGLARGVFHADMWGTRRAKYEQLLESKKNSIPWREVNPTSPFYLFVPQNRRLVSEYSKCWQLSDIFSESVMGIQTHRDHFAFAYEQGDIERRVRSMLDDTISDTALQERYKIRNNRDWRISEARDALRTLESPMQEVILCTYRPFDDRWCFFGYEFMDYPRRAFLDHCHLKENLVLGVGRSGDAVPERPWELIMVSQRPIDANAFRRGGVTAFPLFLYNQASGLEEGGLFSHGDSSYIRKENLRSDFRAFVDDQYGSHYSPHEIVGYIYAVLHSRKYRHRYRDFLRVDYPRIPFVEESRTFETLAKLGVELMQAHLLSGVSNSLNADVMGSGDFKVDGANYDSQRQRVYFNRTQYLYPVSNDIWDFHVGGYPVIEKYLKARKGRALSLDEVEHLESVVGVLGFTLDQMRQIDACWKSRKLLTT